MPRTNSKVTKSVLPLCQYPHAQIEYTCTKEIYLNFVYIIFLYIYIFFYITIFRVLYVYIVYLLGSSCRRV